MRVLVTAEELVLRNLLAKAVEQGLLTETHEIKTVLMNDTGELILNEEQALKLGLFAKTPESGIEVLSPSTRIPGDGPALIRQPQRKNFDVHF